MQTLSQTRPIRILEQMLSVIKDNWNLISANKARFINVKWITWKMLGTTSSVIIRDCELALIQSL